MLAARALQQRSAFPYAFNSGANFILVGMFEWQVEESAKPAKRVYRIVRGPESRRTRRGVAEVPGRPDRPRGNESILG